VDVLTPLFSFRTFGERLEALGVYCVNLSGADPVTFTLEGSETGSNVDPDKTFIKVAAPGQQVSFDLSGGNALVTNWRLSANTDGPGFPAADVKWKIKGQIAK
jgi:hypothetical protein